MMADRQRDTALRRMLRLVGGRDSPGLTDGELLRRFAVEHDEAAFETLLWRHGPMVLSTCRRLLGQLADAEDAFQAVFLVLCRKAGSITNRQSVGSWLYKVAYRICLRARAAAGRHSAAGLEAVVEPEAAGPAFQLPDLAGILDEELNRLPEKYRSPLVLHYLQGKTVEQTAQGLGWRSGTVSGRLARGKELLRARLVRRGVTLTIGTVAGALGRDAVAGALPPALVRAAIRAALLFAASQTLVAGSAVSPRAAALARSALRSLALNRLQLVLGMVLGFVAVALGAGVVLLPSRSGDRPRLEASRAGTDAPGELVARLDADGDPLPQGAVLRLGSARLRHAGRLESLFYSADGSTLIAAGNGVIRTWDARTWQPRTSNVHRSLFFRSLMAVSPDGQILARDGATTPADVLPHKIVLAPLAGDAVLHSLEVPTVGVLSLAFSKDGKYLAAVGYHWNRILFWSVATGQEVRRFDLTQWRVAETSVVFSADLKFLAGIDGGLTPRLWDLSTAQERPLLLPTKSGVDRFAFSANGQVLACGHGGNGVSLCDVRNGKLIRTLHARDSKPPSPLSQSFPQLAISPDGKVAASVDTEGTIRLWDTRASEAEVVLQPGKREPRHARLAFSPDGSTLAVAGQDEIRLWDVDSRRRLPVTAEPDLGSCFAAVSPDGSTIATAGGPRQVFLWDARTGQQIASLDVSGTYVAFSPDSARLVVGDTVNHSLYDLRTRKRITRWRCGGTLSPDQRILATPPCLWQAEDRSTEGRSSRPLWQAPDGGRLAVFSPDGSTIAWALAGKLGWPRLPARLPPAQHTEWRLVTLRDTQTGEERGRIHCPAACSAIALSPDGRTVAVAGLNYIQLWDIESQQMVHELERKPEDLYRFGYDPRPEDRFGSNRRPEDRFGSSRKPEQCFRPIAFSHDSKILAAAGDNHSICLWDTATGRPLGNLSGHLGRIVSLAFTPDGKLVSGSEDTTALVWDVSPH
jgi:RNA polymerase sigma factor (sigma-70 family)